MGNALSPTMGALMAEYWQEIRSNPDIRCTIITGAGDRFFCTGADLQAVSASGKVSGGFGRITEEVRWSSRQNDIWKPTVCAVNGMAVGGGLHFVVPGKFLLIPAPRAGGDPGRPGGAGFLAGVLRGLGVVATVGLDGAPFDARPLEDAGIAALDLSGDLVGVGAPLEAGLLGEHGALEPRQQPAARPPDYARLRKMNVRVHEPRHPDHAGQRDRHAAPRRGRL